MEFQKEPSQKCFCAGKCFIAELKNESKWFDKVLFYRKIENKNISNKNHTIQQFDLMRTKHTRVELASVLKLISYSETGFVGGSNVFY